MKKLLKADEFKAFPAVTTVEYAKADYEQLILAVQPSATWVAEPSASIVVKNDAGVTLRTVAVPLSANAHVQFQVDLVEFDEKFSVTFPAYASVIAVLADKRDISTADVEALPVPAQINSVLDLDSYQ